MFQSFQGVPLSSVGHIPPDYVFWSDEAPHLSESAELSSRTPQGLVPALASKQVMKHSHSACYRLGCNVNLLGLDPRKHWGFGGVQRFLDT